MQPEMSGWRFLLDENIDPKTVTYLEKEGIHAEHVRDALWTGADDMADIIPYARDEELVIVTSDVTDFGGGTLRGSRRCCSSLR
jgi:predicted nuclease of predicted toxin-antitoxin system